MAVLGLVGFQALGVQGDRILGFRILRAIGILGLWGVVFRACWVSSFGVSG